MYAKTNRMDFMSPACGKIHSRITHIHIRNVSVGASVNSVKGKFRKETGLWKLIRSPCFMHPMRKTYHDSQTKE